MKTIRSNQLLTVAAAVALSLALVGGTIAQSRERGGRGGDRTEARNQLRGERGERPGANAPRAEGEGRRAETRGRAPQAAPHHGGGQGFLQGMVKFWDNPRIVNHLELTEEQIASLNQVHEISKTRMEQVEAEARAVRQNIKVEMDKPSPSLDAVNTLSDQLGEVHAERSKAMLAHRIAVKSILSPEQLENLDNIRRRMIQHEGPRHLDGIREQLRKVESADELEAILDERGVTDPQQRERIMNAWERLQSGDAPMPPPAPEAPLPPIF